jgi:hypothetical protein
MSATKSKKKKKSVSKVQKNTLFSYFSKKPEKDGGEVVKMVVREHVVAKEPPKPSGSADFKTPESLNGKTVQLTGNSQSGKSLSHSSSSSSPATSQVRLADPVSALTKPKSATATPTSNKKAKRSESTTIHTTPTSSSSSSSSTKAKSATKAKAKQYKQAAKRAKKAKKLAKKAKQEQEVCVVRVLYVCVFVSVSVFVRVLLCVVCCQL